jgi:hypothetical protein
VNIRRDLIGTWVQCTGPSIFGPRSGGAVEILANGTWRQLARTPGGWEPLEGSNDEGTWQLILPPTAVTAATSAVVRFVAVNPASSADSNSTTAPGVWTTRVSLTRGPHERARFVDGAVVANCRRLLPSATTRATAGA